MSFTNIKTISKYDIISVYCNSVFLIRMILYSDNSTKFSISGKICHSQGDKLKVFYEKNISFVKNVIEYCILPCMFQFWDVGAILKNSNFSKKSHRGI